MWTLDYCIENICNNGILSAKTKLILSYVKFLYVTCIAKRNTVVKQMYELHFIKFELILLMYTGI